MDDIDYLLPTILKENIIVFTIMSYKLKVARNSHTQNRIKILKSREFEKVNIY